MSQSNDPAARTGRMNRNGATQSQSGGVNGTSGTGTRRASGTGTASSFSVTAASVPGAVEPIMNRAATLLRIAESRQNTAPGGAKESYRASAQALRQLLSSAHLAPGLGSGTGLASAPSVSSTQVGDDIRTLRASAKSSRGSQMALLTKAASLYATGTKEYFTAQLREALFDGNVTTAPVVIRGSRSNAAQASGMSGTTRRRGNGGTLPSGIIQNPPSGQEVPVINGSANGGLTTGDPLSTNGSTVIAPGGAVVGTGGVVVPGTVTTGPVIVSPNLPNQPVVNPPVVTPPVVTPPATNP